MTKRELEKVFSKKEGLTIKRSRELIESFFDTVAEQLKSTDTIEITGYGTFRKKIRSNFKAKNPKTKESVIVEKRSYAYFSPGKKFRENIQ